jgi:hypothetical protein
LFELNGHSLGDGRYRNVWLRVKLVVGIADGWELLGLMLGAKRYDGFVLGCALLVGDALDGGFELGFALLVGVALGPGLGAGWKVSVGVALGQHLVKDSVQDCRLEHQNKVQPLWWVIEGC